MHKKKMVSCLSAAMLLLAQAPAYSAGLGKLSINSALGQPLNAEIEVLAADPTELATLQARMASADAYRNANLDMTGALSGLKFVLEKKPSGRSVLRVTSSKPINDPFLDMLIELSWGGGQMVREYTLLLDPPGMMPANNNNVTVAPATSSAPVANAVMPAAEKAITNNSSSEKAVISKSVAKPKALTPVAKPAEVAPAKPESASASNDLAVAATTITAKRGTTLSSLAKQVKPEGVKLEQMLVGLYRQNPSAFNGNMNQMKAGKILKVPSKEDVAAISENDAVREIKLQANDWHSYRQKLASEVAAAPAAESKATPNSGKITPKVEDKAAPVKAGQDVLKLSKGEAPATDNKTANATKPAKPTAAELKQAAQDEAVAKQKALKEANDRAAALEKNIKDMQRLVELKNQSMANMQKEAAKPADTPVPPAAQPEVKPEVKPAPAAVKKPVVKPVIPAPVPVAEPAWYEDINPLYAGGGAVAALLLALFGFMAKSRSRRANLSKFENSIMTNVEAKPNTVYGTQGGAVVNTNNTSFLTDFSQSGLGSLDTHDVDPIAEAEVYMAYGRDAQAEEILKEAMVKDPARHEIKLKLLEIYAGRKNLPAFESIATELYSALGGENTPVWEKAAELGRSLDPNNPLYGGSVSAVPEVDHPNVEPVADEIAEVASIQAGDIEDQVAVAADEGVMDLSGALDFDSESLDTSEVEHKEVVAEEDISADGMLDMSEFELPAEVEPVVTEATDVMDFDMPDVAHQEVAVEADEPVKTEVVVVPEVLAHDDNMLNFDFNLDEHDDQEVAAEEAAASVAATEDIALDFSGISLDFDEPEAEVPVVTMESAEATEVAGKVNSAVEETPIVPELSEAEQEVKTKLDLAQVYLEMGDNENAREILQEVMQEGNAQQQEQAHAFLQQAG